MIAKGPIIFLSLNQVGSGEFDAYIEPLKYSLEGPNTLVHSYQSFNYTHFKYLWDDKYNIAPRYHQGKVYSIDVPDIKDQYLNMWDT